MDKQMMMGKVRNEASPSMEIRRKVVKKELNSASAEANRRGTPTPTPTPTPMPMPMPLSSSSKLMIVEDELKTSKRECEELREHVLRLKEDKRVISDRETRGEERYRKLLDDVKNQEEVQRARVVELQCRIKDMERGKRSAEALVELYKCRFEELGSRVSRMEEDCKVLLSEQHLANAANERPYEAVDRYKGPHSSQIARSTEAEVDDPSESEMKFESHVMKKRASEVIVEIIDSDDEPMGDSSLASALKRNRVLPSVVPRTASWEIESDMLSSLEKDPKLCMRAVCALYRDKFFEEKSVKGLEHPTTQSIEKSDALRGTMLAEYLIAGDSEGKLKKSLPELLKKQDLNDCKMLATKYSMKLFEIYKKWGDPLFHPIFSKLQ